MSETYKTSHWTAGNFQFPTRIEVTNNAVVRRIKELIGQFQALPENK